MNINYDDVFILKNSKLLVIICSKSDSWGCTAIIDVLDLIKNLNDLYLLGWTLYIYFSYMYERYKFIDIYIAGLCPRNFSHKWLGYWIR